MALTQNQQAFLTTIALSELGSDLIAATDNGYNCLVGSTAENPLTFSDYSTHPDILNQQFDSTAAGRYQIIHPTWVGLCNKLGVSDFSPATQDNMALELIYERGAEKDVNDGNFADAIQKCSMIWASLPGGTSGQHEQPLALLQQYYTDAGGILA